MTFVIEIIGLLLSLFSPTLSVPTSIPWIIVFLGLVWASFQVYQDTYAKIPIEKIVETTLEISLIEGNEYFFNLEQEVSQDKLVPDAFVKIFFRLVNPNPWKIDVLSIFGGHFIIHDPFMIYPYLGEPIETGGQVLSFPFTLEIGEVFYFNIVIPIKCGNFTNAQFAARLRSLTSNSENGCELSINVEVMNSEKKIQNFRHNLKLSLRQLWDLYTQGWIRNQALNLVRLANENISINDLPAIGDPLKSTQN